LCFPAEYATYVLQGTPQHALPITTHLSASNFQTDAMLPAHSAMFSHSAAFVPVTEPLNDWTALHVQKCYCVFTK